MLQLKNKLKNQLNYAGLKLSHYYSELMLNRVFSGKECCYRKAVKWKLFNNIL